MLNVLHCSVLRRFVLMCGSWCYVICRTMLCCGVLWYVVLLLSISRGT